MFTKKIFFFKNWRYFRVTGRLRIFGRVKFFAKKSYHISNSEAPLKLFSQLKMLLTVSDWNITFVESPNSHDNHA